VAEDSSLSGCDAVSLGERILTFQRTVTPTSSTAKQSKKNSPKNSLTLEDEATMMLQIIRNHSPNDTASHSRRADSPSIILVMQ